MQLHRHERAPASFAAGVALVLAAGIGSAPVQAATITSINSIPSLAPGESAAPAPAASKSGTDLYIVQLKELPAIAYEGDIPGYEATKPGKGKRLNPHSAHVRKYADYLQKRQGDVMQAAGAARQAYSYTYAFNGFAAHMTAAQAEALRRSGDVVQVWRNEFKQPTTDSTPAYIGLTHAGGAWLKGFDGENVVVGSIDTGIWPEHPSFSDQGCQGDGGSGGANRNNPGQGCNTAAVYGAAPPQWNPALNEPGTCEFGNEAFNPTDAPFACNGKLLAARFYAAAFSSPGTTDGAGLIPGEYLSARDNDGHGSHTASTAAGNAKVHASIEGVSLGQASGMAPRARIATYKVCWNGSVPRAGFSRGCGTADSTAAIDQAVADGVDVINYSIGGASTNFSGADDVAFLFAADAGVFVATSNGNDGPLPQTTGTPSGEPWLIAVANTQDNQVFGPEARVTSPASVAGSYLGIEGTSPVQFADAGIIAGDIVPTEPLNACTSLTNPAAVANQIALVIRGGCTFNQKHIVAQEAGARAILVYNSGATAGDELPITMGGVTDGTIPGMMIRHTQGVTINAAAAGDTITGDVGKLAPLNNSVAVSSSRGPNGGAPDIIKPDISAPGTRILAAQTPIPNDDQVPGQLFQIISGTSMASPHIAGVGAALKQAHPDWSPAMIKSAIMTTARRNLTKSLSTVAADPFDIGSGMVRASAAFDPGLVYDAGLFDYAAFMCHEPNQVSIFSPASCAFLDGLGFPQDSSDLNLPSIAIAGLIGVQTVTRTVTSVAPGTKSFTVSVEPPPGVDVVVSPSTLKLQYGQSASYQVTLTANASVVPGEWSFGSLTWKNGGYAVYSPIAVRPGLIHAPDEIVGTGTEGSASWEIQVGYSGEFGVQAHGLHDRVVFSGTVADDPGNSFQFLGPGTDNWLINIPPNSIYLRMALFNEDTDGDDDLDLYLYTCTPTLSCTFVTSSGNADSNEEVNVLLPVGNGGPWLIFVHGWETDGPDANYDLSVWAPGLDDDAGNMTVTGPTSAVPGPAPVSIEWSGLAPGTRYLGGVSYRDTDAPPTPASLLDFTVVGINTQ